MREVLPRKGFAGAEVRQLGMHSAKATMLAMAAALRVDPELQTFPPHSETRMHRYRRCAPCPGRPVQ